MTTTTTDLRQCRYCGDMLHREPDGAWVDDTDGDVCSGNDQLDNENGSHVPETAPEAVLRAAQTIRHDDDGRPIVRMATCGACGRAWNDAATSSRTPVPAGRCPFEAWHEPVTTTCETCALSVRQVESGGRAVWVHDDPAYNPWKPPIHAASVASAPEETCRDCGEPIGQDDPAGLCESCEGERLTADRLGDEYRTGAALVSRWRKRAGEGDRAIGGLAVSLAWAQAADELTATLNGATILAPRDDELCKAARVALDTLEHLTTEAFAHGGDRPARAALVAALASRGLATPEEVADYA